MRFAWIHVEKATYAVRRLCRVLAVTPSGYYAWMHRLPSQRARDNDRLQVRIRAIHAASRGTYGSPRVHEQLTQEGCAVGRERVARLLRDMGLVGRAIFDRYNIIHEQELLDAGDQLVEYLAQQAQAVPARRRPHTAGAAAPRTASPLRLVRRGTA